MGKVNVSFNWETLKGEISHADGYGHIVFGAMPFNFDLSDYRRYMICRQDCHSISFRDGKITTKSNKKDWLVFNFLYMLYMITEDSLRSNTPYLKENLNLLAELFVKHAKSRIITSSYSYGPYIRLSGDSGHLWRSVDLRKYISQCFHSYDTDDITAIVAPHTIVQDIEKIYFNSVTHFSYPSVEKLFKNSNIKDMDTIQWMIENQKIIHHAYTKGIKEQEKRTQYIEELKNNIPPYLQNHYDIDEKSTYFGIEKELVRYEYVTCPSGYRYTYEAFPKKWLNDENAESFILHLISIIRGIKDISEMLNISIDFNNNYSIFNLYSIYNNLILTVLSQLDEIKNRKFKENQEKINISIEGYKIVIPTSRAECSQIGEDFKNCLGGYEWSHFLEDGKRYCGAIYKDNKPFICFDVDVSTKGVIQWLGKSNSTNKSNESKNLLRIVQDYFKNL